MANLFIKHTKWLYNELGLSSVWKTGPDAWLLILGRSFRMFAFGANSLIIALFFASLNFTDFQIGLFMTLTLVGDVLLSFFLTLIADRIGRRKILFIGSALMVLSGFIFALFENFWILLFAAVVGVISATGGDFGPFRAIEESTLSHLTSPNTRADVLAWYVTTASLGSSIGTLLSGWSVNYLQSRVGWSTVDSYHTVFWVYVIMGALNMGFSLLLSKKCEIEEESSGESGSEGERMLLTPTEQVSEDSEDEIQTPIDPQHAAKSSSEKKKKPSFFATVSAETRYIMYKLWFLLIIDSLADGMVSYSLTNYFLDRKFHLAKSTLGTLISISYLLSSLSTIFAGPLARRLGLINTMVFTHLPSSVAVLLFPFPNNIFLTVALFYLRTGLNNMDQAPRSAFIAAVVKPEERTAVMGITSMLRTLASTAGPTVTGVLAGNNRFWIAFVAAGSLRICYDLGLWAMFVNMKLYQHEEKNGKGLDTGRTRDEEEVARSVDGRARNASAV